jgi:hypothetical protein
VRGADVSVDVLLVRHDGFERRGFGDGCGGLDRLRVRSVRFDCFDVLVEREVFVNVRDRMNQRDIIDGFIRRM